MERPPRYHQRHARQPYMRAIEQLHRRGLHDDEIAHVLTYLDPLDLPELAHLGRDAERLDDLLHDEPFGLPWTARQIQYYRGQLGLAGHWPHPPTPPSAESRQDQRIRYQCSQGWERLLPRVLTQPEVSVMNVLRDRGEQTLRLVCAALGWAYHRRGWPYTVVRNLCRAAIVAVVGRLNVTTRPLALYGLAASVKIG